MGTTVVSNRLALRQTALAVLSSLALGCWSYHADHQDSGAGDAGTSDGSTADAGPLDAPDPVDATAPDAVLRPLRVFVSSTQHDGALAVATPTGADGICTELAEAAGLGGRWVSWTPRDGVSAYARLEGQGPFVNVFGTEVFARREDLIAGAHVYFASRREIAYDETGAMHGDEWVWTGTGYEGESQSDCHFWGDTTATGVVGALGQPSAEWTRRGVVGCETLARVYCFEQP